MAQADLVEVHDDGATQTTVHPKPAARAKETFTLLASPFSPQGSVIDAGDDELVMPNCEQTWANVCELADASPVGPGSVVQVVEARGGPSSAPVPPPVRRHHAACPPIPAPPGVPRRPCPWRRRACALAAARPLRESETLPLLAARGRVLAAPALAALDLPPFDNSAMDGYALHADDLAGGDLLVQGRVLAGEPPGPPLRSGTVRRIMTGAPVPSGTAAVVMQERVRRLGDALRLDGSVPLGANLRRRGEDRAAGSDALEAGHHLTPAAMALLAGCGLAAVSVLRRLRVTLLSSGNELVEPGEPLAPGQIVNTNRVLLGALLSEPWVDLDDAGTLPDDPGLIRRAIRAAASRSDVVVSSGGVSAGEADHLLDALRREGATLDVLKVAMRPGKPLTVGRVGGALWVGLPGNPFAAAVTFTQIARPALRCTAGLSPDLDTWIPSVADFDYARTTGRTEFVPVAWDSRDAIGRPVLRRLGSGASASLGPLALAQGLAVIPPGHSAVRPGTPLAVEPLPS